MQVCEKGSSEDDLGDGSSSKSISARK